MGLPRALKIGTYTAPSDPDLAPVPAVVRFPAEGSIVISAESARDAGRAFLSSLILQLIAKTEPGTYHFQFVDPVGLGDTFAPFLHLNEIDDSIILGRVVSQRQEIGKLLDQALIHIETVTQQFLKSSYKTLSDYNVAADATAERFRYLVISDYPQGFDSETASKLKSVMQHGPRCGVHTIVLGKSNTSTSTFNEPLDINSLDANAAYISVGEHHGGSLTCDTDASLTDQRSPTDVAELVGDPWLERGTPARIKLNSRTVSEQRLVGLSVQDVAFCVISSAGSPSIQEAADLLAAVRNSGATTGGLVVVGRTASRDALRISALVPDGSEFRLESATVEICVPSDALADLAAITGAQIVDTVAAVIEDASVVGGCGQVRFSTDELEIQSGRGGIFELRTQRSSIKTAFAEATDSAERLRNAARWEKSIGSAVPEGNVGLARLQYESLAAPALPTLGATLHGKKTEYLKLALDMPPLLRMSDSEDNGLFGQLLMTTARAGTRRESKIVTADDAFAMMMRADARREQQSGEGAQAMLPIPDDPSTWWSMSSKDEIRTPIGRTGAREACCITFDSKMESAAIVIGTTGSGKSTMLHSFILGACMQYPPEELELYLLDSKQGVEFKVYEHLPHARAVAIHNEREFGVSVMRGLREELERRAALIKGATSGGEVGLPGYRDATGDRLPRIVMVADEFHELFEIDDALGREARELLDDLIRQGRSYGIHVFLGSQTLDGAEAMPTHAIGLIQTRIAFACRQQDAEVVMSPQNAEVMSLSGAGDGIFNSQRGTPEANQRFQGSMSTSGERIEIVQQVLNRAVGSWDRRPIVFDGDAPARLDDFPASDFVLAGPSETVRARIGEPCEISGSVTLELARRPGANVVAILEERAGTSFIQCLAAAAHANPSLSMAVIDYLGSEDPVLASVLCDRITHSRRRAGAARIAELAELVFQRIESDDYSSPPRLLVITGLKAMRDIDQIPDQGEPISNLLQKIASDGPEVGVHLILIDDSIRSFERRIDRGLLGEFGIRIVG
ncbi:MAG: FtsK/SpoIIIE domain-containing protein, partial [Solirubrobacterales bacterium]